MPGYPCCQSAFPAPQTNVNLAMGVTTYMYDDMGLLKPFNKRYDVALANVVFGRSIIWLQRWTCSVTELASDPDS